VVDNDSPEKPVDFIKNKFPDVHFIESKENLGFGKANNLGVKKAKAEYVLILNPDTVIPENLFDKILPFAESKSDLGALGVRLIDADGNFHPESKRNIPDFKNTFGKLFSSFFDKSKSKGYYKSDVGEFETAPAEILVGAFMFLKKEIYQKCGGFDERYFMYGEDIDLSYSLILNGLTNYYFGDSTAIHYKGESTRKDKKYLKIFFGAMEIFIKKHYSKPFFQYLVFLCGLKLRKLWADLNGSFKPEDKTSKPKTGLNDLKWIENENQIDDLNQNYALDGNLFSHQQMISIISRYRKTNRNFYIKPKFMEVLIGSGIVQKLEK
jgi:GT2 family glycosyltransferase